MRRVGRREINVDAAIPAEEFRWNIRVQQGTALGQSRLPGRQGQKKYKQSAHHARAVNFFAV